MNKWVKMILEALVSGVIFFLFEIFFYRDNLNWGAITTFTLVYIVIFFVVSLLVNLFSKKKNENKEEIEENEDNNDNNEE